MTRADLLALTPDALAALTNRGLVKRATREVEATPPAVTVDGDGTVRGRYADGPETSLPAGGLERGSCTCGATGICRHVVGLVLAYQSNEPDTEAVPETRQWSPGRFTDEQLEARIGARQLAAARRTHRAGYAARVHRPSTADAAPRVELGSATVRFLVPDDLGFVHTDAVAGARDDVLALAVWAFRVADAKAPDDRDVQVDVGGPETAGVEGGDGSLDAAVRLADEVLLTGATHVGPGLAGTVAEVRQRLDRAGLRWPLLAVGDLEEQLAAYEQRGSTYSHERLAGIVAELHARHRAVANRGSSLRARVLGTQEAAETPMRRARLDGLGCRVRAVGDTDRQVEIYFAHADSATVLVLRRTFGDAVETLKTRRVGGATVAQLAAGNVVTESAIRSASRTVRLATSRVAKTTVTPSQGAWTSLPDALVVRDLRDLAAELDRLPPRVVRPRVEAELVRVVQVAEVRSVRYTPGAQRLDAVIADPAGNPATITATHTAAAPGALDAIAAALDGPVRAVAGTVGRTGGEIVVEPLGLAVGDDAVVVPDLAPAGGFRVDGTLAVGGDPLRHVVDAAVALLAEVPHRGLRMLPPTFPNRLRDAGEMLTRVGLHRAAAAVGALRAGLGPDPDAVAAGLWVDAYLRLLVTTELQ
ncbi:hypothetical protein ACFO1B_42480 [Dactylosporangium siamense]|uniref:SWIM-type domain-containing protein n=1 Tax=Dactylosporangium siamense TaxID=685454 RepID=A0A919PWR2_9ACTN|nr:hypothetical protein [Dactylosporangium siamense]GIG51092.1 hypothetical protein Dsi01nite_091330 [Dactylosporangium siamense]